MTESRVDNLQPIFNRHGEMTAVQFDIDHMPVICPLPNVVPVDPLDGMPGFDPRQPEYFVGQEPSARTIRATQEEYNRAVAGEVSINQARSMMGIEPSESEKLAIRAEWVAKVIRILAEDR